MRHRVIAPESGCDGTLAIAGEPFEALGHWWTRAVCQHCGEALALLGLPAFIRPVPHTQLTSIKSGKEYLPPEFQIIKAGDWIVQDYKDGKFHVALSTPSGYRFGQTLDHNPFARNPQFECVYAGRCLYTYRALQPRETWQTGTSVPPSPSTTRRKDHGITRH